MSLQEVYRLAHTAECRLNISAARPDRNLRFVVGHLMHYEALRLRIVEIEHDIGRRQRAAAVQFKGTGHVESGPRHVASTGQLGKRSPDHEDEDDAADTAYDSEASDNVDVENDCLGLTRFPSGDSRPPALVSDDEEEEEEKEEEEDLTEPTSPEEPDAATLERTLRQQPNDALAQEMEKVRKCPCHGKSEVEHIKNVWELPATANDKPGLTRAVAQVAV